MKFGVFDQNDRGGLPLSDQYEERLRLATLYDELGFHCIHTSEHHATPLSTCPSQNVWLSAVLQRTRRLHVCPLVYLLPIHHPLRLAEEICMLDHLGRGRFQFGVGRGASPHELAAFGVTMELAQEMYLEAFEVLRKVFVGGVLNHAGRFWQVHDVPVEMTPLQQPHPPMWYALAAPDSTVWPAREGVNIVIGGPVARVREITDRYRAEWHAAHPAGGRMPLIGVNRYIVVAATDAEAMEVGRVAWPTFYGNFMKLWNRHGTQPRVARLPPSFDAVVESGHAIVGSAATVRDAVLRQVMEGGMTYLIGSFHFGSMDHSVTRSSVRRFAVEVMPAVSAASREAA